MVNWLRKREWLVIILALVVMLRIPSLFEPYWYGDEAIYLTLGQAINKGVPLYSAIHDNKPPLLYVMAAVAQGNQFWFKFLAMTWNLVTIGVFGQLVEKVFEHRKKQVMISTLVFAVLTTIPLWEGNIVNAELFFLLPTILAANLVWKKQVSSGYVFLAGTALGIAALFKMPAILEAGVWPLVWLRHKEKGAIKKVVYLAAGVMFPILVSGVYFALSGNFWQYFTAAWMQNIPYLSSWQSASAGNGIYTIKGRAIVAAVLLAVIWGFSGRLKKTATIVGIWGVITLFAALLSGRPYPHYLMQMSGVCAIAIAMVWEKKAEEKAEKIVAAGIVLGVIAAYAAFRFYVYPIGAYYTNFVSWVWGQKTTASYYDWFSPEVRTNYDIAALIRGESEESEKIFVWGDEPVVYALAHRLPVGRFTTKYHIKELRAENEVMMQLQNNPPKFVVSFGDENELPGFSAWLQNNYALEKRNGNVKTYRWTRLSTVISRL
jgi:hypothetical protein